MSLFNVGDFTLHSGAKSYFKIDCDALTDQDIEALALLIKNNFTFHAVEGVPRGGLRLAKALEKYCIRKSQAKWSHLLIVDDVLTTGNSMRDHKRGRPAVGVVIFARGYCPTWVWPIFNLEVNTDV